MDAHSQSLKDAGDRIRSERLRLGYTQRAFAEAVEISVGSQVLYEKGRISPRITYIRAACDLGADLLYLVTGQKGDTVALRDFDWAKYEKVVRIMEDAIANLREPLSTEQKASLIRLLVCRFESSDTVDGAEIHTTVETLFPNVETE